MTASEIHKILKECFKKPVSEAECAKILASPLYIFEFSHVEKTPAGVSIGLLAEDVLDIITIAVAPAFRRQNLGEKMLENLILKAQTRGAKQVFLEVNANNAPAVNLYKKCGFSQISIRKGYYDGEDALIFLKNLTQNG